MSYTEKEKADDAFPATEDPRDIVADDPLADTSALISHEIPPGVDRRNFLIRSAVGGAAAVMMGRVVSAETRTAMAVATMPQAKAAAQAKGNPTPPLAKDLNVVKKGAGPV